VDARRSCGYKAAEGEIMTVLFIVSSVPFVLGVLVWPAFQRLATRRQAERKRLEQERERVYRLGSYSLGDWGTH
jgi:hypothetical protein